MPTHRADTRLSRRSASAAPASVSPRRAMQAALAAEAAAARRARRRARLPQLVGAGALAVAATVAVPAATVPDVGQPLLGGGRPAEAVAATGVPAAASSGRGPALRVGPALGPAQAAPALPPPSLAAPPLPRAEQLERASRNRQRPVLPGCAGVVADPAAANGQLSDADLCTLWLPEHRLRPDAAVAAAELNRSYRMAFGTDLCVSDSYRSLEAQHSVAARKPHLAALPGTSDHGWGLALDLCGGVQDDSTPQYAWMAENAGAFGWANPEWARRGGSGPFEPWHWEYGPPVG